MGSAGARPSWSGQPGSLRFYFQYKCSNHSYLVLPPTYLTTQVLALQRGIYILIPT